MRKTFAIITGLVAVLGAIWLLFGARSGADVILRPVADPAITQGLAAENRRAFFGTDPMAGSELKIDLQFTPRADSVPRLDTQVQGQGDLIVGGQRLPLTMAGTIESRTTAKGHTYYLGSTDGQLTIRGETVPTGVVVNAIPAQKKYMISLTLQPASGEILLLLYGEPFDEYNEVLKEKFGGP